MRDVYLLTTMHKNYHVCLFVNTNNNKSRRRRTMITIYNTITRIVYIKGYIPELFFIDSP